MPLAAARSHPKSAMSPPKSAFPPPLDLTNLNWRTMDRGDTAAITRKNDNCGRKKVTSPPKSAFPPPIEPVKKSSRRSHKALVTDSSSESNSSRTSTLSMPLEQKKDSSSLDMRFNDDEFAYLAHMILNHCEASSSSQASTRASCNEGGSSVITGVFHYFGNPGGSKRDDASDENGLMILTPELLEKFKLALKYRLKRIPPIESPEEGALIAITREVARVVSIKGFPAPYKGPARIITKASLDSSTSTKGNRGNDRSRNSESQNSTSRESKGIEMSKEKIKDSKIPSKKSGKKIEPITENSNQARSSSDPKKTVIIPPSTPQKSSKYYVPESPGVSSTNTKSTAESQLTSSSKTPSFEPPSSYRDTVLNALKVETVAENSDTNSTDQSSTNFTDGDVFEAEIFFHKRATEEEESFQSSSNHYISDGQTYETASSIPSSQLSQNIQHQQPSAGSPEHIRQQYHNQQEQQVALIYKRQGQYCDLQYDYPIHQEQHVQDFCEPIFEIVEEPAEVILETYVERPGAPTSTDIIAERNESHCMDDLDGVDRSFEEQTLVIQEKTIRQDTLLNPNLHSEAGFSYQTLIEKHQGTQKVHHGNGSPLVVTNLNGEINGLSIRSQVTNSNDHYERSSMTLGRNGNEIYSGSFTKNINDDRGSGHYLSPLRNSGSHSFLYFDEKEQMIEDEIARVKKMRGVTTISVVKLACEEQLLGLEVELEQIKKAKSELVDESAYPEQIVSNQDRRSPKQSKIPRSGYSIMNETNSIVTPGSYSGLSNANSNPNLVMGRWKDKAWNIFTFGPCHASVTGSILFPLVALGQVMTRLQISWILLPNRSNEHPKDAFRISVALTMFWITVNCLVFYLPPPGLSLITIISLASVNAVMYLYYVSNVIRARLELRHAYLIPNNFRDVLIGGFLAPFAVMQMLRHTCDYDTYSGQLFTPTGLPDHVTIPVPSAIRQKHLRLQGCQA